MGRANSLDRPYWSARASAPSSVLASVHGSVAKKAPALGPRSAQLSARAKAPEWELASVHGWGPK